MTPKREDLHSPDTEPVSNRAPHGVQGRCVLSDPNRIATLHRLHLLDGTSEPAFERLVRLAQQALGAPVCLLSFVDDQNQYFKAAIGLTGDVAETRKTPLSHSFCQHVVTSGRALIVEDSRVDPLVRANLAVRDLSVIAYMGVPIQSPDGFVLGSFCVIDSQPRAWKNTEVALLHEFSLFVTHELAMRERRSEADAALEASRGQLHRLQGGADCLVSTEAQMQAVLESASVGIASIDTNGVFTTWNPAMEELLGWSGREVVGVATPEILLDAEETARLMRLHGTSTAPVKDSVFIVSVLKEQLPCAWEATVRRKDHSRLPVLLHLGAIRTADRTFTGAVLVLLDLTGRKEIESTLEQARDPALEAAGKRGETLRRDPTAPSPRGSP